MGPIDLNVTNVEDGFKFEQIPRDTVFHTLNRLEPKSEMLLNILDILVDENKIILLKNNQLPFFGTIDFSAENKSKNIVVKLSNANSFLKQDDFFIQNVRGSFIYRHIFFYVVFENDEMNWFNRYFSLTSDCIKTFSISTEKNKTEFTYPSIWTTRSYSDENGILKLIYANHDTIDSRNYVR